MASRHTTIVIVPENSSRMKHFRFSRTFLFSAATILVLSFVAISVVLFDYCMLKSRLPYLGSLEHEVKQQREQIQVFADKIDTLKSNVEELRGFEKKIRVIANVEDPQGEDGVFGIGGSMPSDLASNLPLTDKHHSLVREMRDQVDFLCDVSTVQKDAFENLHVYLEGQKSLLASRPSIRPTTGWISSGFGYRKSPFTGLREFHRGLDIATRMGTPVVAPADGRVTFVGKKGGLGRTVVIDHGHGIVTRYAHLKEFLVKKGARVHRGDQIALVGNSGRTTAPHLHYEVHVDGLPSNPQNYILN